jgi:hypothetical protein
MRRVTRPPFDVDAFLAQPVGCGKSYVTSELRVRSSIEL